MADTISISELLRKKQILEDCISKLEILQQASFRNHDKLKELLSCMPEGTPDITSSDIYSAKDLLEDYLKIFQSILRNTEVSWPPA